LAYEEINSGKVLAELLNIPPIPRISRRKFQAAATEFINSRNGSRRLARAICKYANRLKSERVVVDGVRHRETLNSIKEFSKRDVAVIYVQAAPDLAYQLYSKRENKSISPRAFFELYSASVEGDVRYLIQDADAIIYNWTGRSEYDAVLDALGTELKLYNDKRRGL
jgi:hypothetical protein